MFMSHALSMADLDAAFTLLRNGKVVASGAQTELDRNIEIRLYVTRRAGWLGYAGHECNRGR